MIYYILAFVVALFLGRRIYKRRKAKNELKKLQNYSYDKLSLYFGLPGCGKTTYITKICCDEIQKMVVGRSPYRHIYTNVKGIRVPGVEYVPFSYFGKYEIDDCLYIVDEATINADSRDFKTFPMEKIQYLCEHRKHRCEIFFFTQFYNRLDKTIRDLCCNVYYLRKGKIFKHRTNIYTLKYGIIIGSEDNKKEDKRLGDISQGYGMPSFFERLFCKRFDRRPYYGLFDTEEVQKLQSLPPKEVRDKVVI